MSGVLRDITGQKVREQQLHESEQRLRLALRAGRSGVWEWIFGSDELYWDERTQRIFGHEVHAEPVPFA
ncbi:hypothetical protein NL445_29075, partial [Klebsiella pneumoniae]|nr:hypothetical protein [Klebsiella pneumoniae]